MTEVSLLKKALRSVVAGQVRAAADPYRPGWHLAPPVGLLNDPNGFIQHNGRFHLFYQWNPLACAHGAKFWGHWSSADLLHWQHEPLALAPSEEYETHGCYSGSAVTDNGQLTLIYTGNVKYPDGSRTAFQCLARENAEGEFDKTGPVFNLPQGYTGHVRDPKVWWHDKHWYMVLGAQDLSLQGKVLLLRSDDLSAWDLLGEIAGSGLHGLGEFGYMWECPDLFRLAENDILICCPQGLAAESDRYLNTFQSGYFVGQLDYANATFTHGDFAELDLGFEFYAPQTTQTDDGRRLLIGWMGIPDGDEFFQPTIQNGWLHTLTCPRELTLVAGKIIQKPARELQQLRRDEQTWQGIADYCLPLDITHAETEIVTEHPFIADFGGDMTLSFDGEWLRLSRKNRRTGVPEHRVWQGQLRKLTVLSDASSLEIFINDGEAVMSARYFPVLPAQLNLQGSHQITLRHWSLAECVIE
ncbi:sucrose-6-phosphate hydrolase (plasmid) [Rahnella aquatilis]|jgi:beta-fructofuranosidase|nr:sucrose-6-phosphate hydrolase [Rahnella aquatilis]QEU49741.1 sucrose-6-phosphate hydrolase [Rahnella aquatilis]QEU50768.1 sucrose-6-phosphate hydrolase [Rahnella aquatilis]QEU51794.1 sucrose-6-phosphate hydrolase [Rahnella aquatilis]